MNYIKPKHLKPGDVIGVCAPASPPQSETTLNKGISYIERCGFRVEVGKNILKRKGYLAGSDKERASDLNSLFANPKVKAIFTARGGYGSHRILPLLNYNLIRKNPKIVVGYSDITALQFALLSKTGLISFSGPMVASEMCGSMSKNVEEKFWRMLSSPLLPQPLVGKGDRSSIINRKGISSGVLFGGNLSLVTALCGTQYFPNINNPIMILEEIDERPYRIDRMLQQLLVSGKMKDLNGIALGDFNSCLPDKGKPSLTIQQIFNEVFRKFKIPIVSGIVYGHVKHSTPFPIGVKVKIDGGKNSVEFLESGVS